MKLTRLAFGLVLGLAAAGCGSDDNTCGDAACPDSAVTTLAGGASDGAAGAIGTISTGKYKALSVNIGEDGCMINPMGLVTANMTDPMSYVPVTVMGGTMSVGNPKGDGVNNLPSLGTGDTACGN